MHGGGEEHLCRVVGRSRKADTHHNLTQVCYERQREGAISKLHPRRERTKQGRWT